MTADTENTYLCKLNINLSKCLEEIICPWKHKINLSVICIVEMSFLGCHNFCSCVIVEFDLDFNIRLRHFNRKKNTNLIKFLAIKSVKSLRCVVEKIVKPKRLAVLTRRLLIHKKKILTKKKKNRTKISPSIWHTLGRCRVCIVKSSKATLFKNSSGWKSSRKTLPHEPGSCTPNIYILSAGADQHPYFWFCSRGRPERTKDFFFY